jgi:oleandomycin transport system ATP-binding protein
VLGPNGAGKTTAVRILATLLPPDAGTATVAGHDVVREAAQVRRIIGLTGRYASVDEDLTGTQNLVLIGELRDLRRRDARSRAAELLAWFDLTEAANRPAKTYSGGMRGVVRLIVADGSTVLLTTRYLEEADALADEISVIDHGRVIAHRTPAQLKRIAGSQTVVVRPTRSAR